MAMPDTVNCEVAFSTNPTSIPVWTDVSHYLRSFKTSRGRQHELDRTQTGTATIVLDNRDRRFDPSYGGTPFNLCLNPSFETDLAQWVNDGDGASTYVPAVRVTSQFFSGAASADINITASNGVPRSVRFVTVFNTTPGQTYTLSVYFKATVNNGVSQMFLAFDNADQPDPSIHIASVGTLGTGLGAWTRLTITAVCPAGVIHGRLAILTGACTGHSYFDGAQVEAGAAATTYEDGSLAGYHWNGVAHESITIKSSPYYLQILPMRQIRLFVTWAGQTYYLFRGYVEGWPQSMPGQYDNIVTIQAQDGMGAVLAANKLNTSFSQETSGARVNEVLDLCNWQTGSSWIIGDPGSLLGTTAVLGPNDDRAVDTGNSLVQSVTLSNTFALQHLQDIQLAEQGMMFVDGRGNFVWNARLRNALYHNSFYTFGGGANELPYYSLGDIAYDIYNVRNDILLTATGSTLVEVSDAASKLTYYERDYQLSNLQLVDDGVTIKGMANWLLRLYKDAHLRLPSMVLRPQGDDRLWTPILSAELAQIYTVHRTPQSLPGGSVIEMISRLEGIDHSYSPQMWETTFRLSPVDQTNYWILGDGTYGVLGTTTTLAY